MNKNRVLLVAAVVVILISLLFQFFAEHKEPEQDSTTGQLEDVTQLEQVDLDDVNRTDLQSESADVKEPPATIVFVKTYSGVTVPGQLMIGMDEGEPLSFGLDADGAEVLQSQLTFDDLRAKSLFSYLVLPDGGGFVRGEKMEESVAEDGEATLTIFIPDPRRVGLNIMDHHQDPVADARVVPFELANIWGAKEWSTIQSDADGFASFDAFYGERTFRVEISAWGYGSQIVDIDAQTQELDIKLDRIHVLGMVYDRSKPYSIFGTGSASSHNFGGKRFEDWQGIAKQLEDEQQLQPTEYIDWMVEAESGKWKEAEEFTIKLVMSDGSYFITTAVMMALLDPEFVVWRYPSSFHWQGPEVPVRLSLGPESCFPSGYPDLISIPLVKASNLDVAAASGVPAGMFGGPNVGAIHQGGGHYLAWTEPGIYEIDSHSNDGRGNGNKPNFVPDQIVTLEEGRDEVEILLDPDERYVGIRVLDSAGFPFDCRWLLRPQGPNDGISFLSHRREVTHRFIRPGTWSLIGGNLGQTSKGTPPLTDGLLWPAPLDANGVWSIRVQNTEPLAKPFSWH
jgi:hypothetical protein